MVYDITYSSDSRILIRTFKGRIRFSEVFESWDYLVRNDKIGPEVIGILNDFIYAELIMSRDDLVQLMSYFQENSEIFERIKLAVVMMSPESIVLPVIASQNYPQFKIEAFSTLDAAEKWLRQ